MKRIICFIILLLLLVKPVSAMEIAPPEVPEEGEYYMPEETESFSEALSYVIMKALKQITPDLISTLKSCISLLFVMILLTIVQNFASKIPETIQLIGSLIMGAMMLSPSKVLIQEGIDAIIQMTEYAKLLLPVMTSALAAQGGVTASAALYAGSAFFSSILSNLILKVSVPMLYIFLCLSIAKATFSNDMLSHIHKFVRWAITWSIKIVLYVFIGYMSVTGVISGSADASAVRAVKLSLNGMIPVVGSILSEASETILVSAGMMKNAAGVYGIIAVLALVVAPILKIGAQYLMLNISCGIGEMLGANKQTLLLKDFSTGMGMLFAMTGAVCLLVFISTVCFMKGMS